MVVGEKEALGFFVGRLNLNGGPAGSETSTWCRLSTPPRRWPISDHRQRGRPPRWPFERSTSLLIIRHLEGTHTKPIHSEWPHPSGGSLSLHRKSPFIRNGHTPQAEAYHHIEKAHSFRMVTLTHLHLYDTTICPRSRPVFPPLNQNT